MNLRIVNSRSYSISILVLCIGGLTNALCAHTQSVIYCNGPVSPSPRSTSGKSHPDRDTSNALGRTNISDHRQNQELFNDQVQLNVEQHNAAEAQKAVDRDKADTSFGMLSSGYGAQNAATPLAAPAPGLVDADESDFSAPPDPAPPSGESVPPATEQNKYAIRLEGYRRALEDGVESTKQYTAEGVKDSQIGDYGSGTSKIVKAGSDIGREWILDAAKGTPAAPMVYLFNFGFEKGEAIFATSNAVETGTRKGPSAETVAATGEAAQAQGNAIKAAYEAVQPVEKEVSAATGTLGKIAKGIGVANDAVTAIKTGKELYEGTTDILEAPDHAEKIQEQGDAVLEKQEQQLERVKEKQDMLNSPPSPQQVSAPPQSQEKQFTQSLMKGVTTPTSPAPTLANNVDQSKSTPSKEPAAPTSPPASEAPAQSPPDDQPEVPVPTPPMP